MRLAFPNGEHDELAIGKGSFSIGNSDRDDVVIGADVPGHAIVTVDQRGITLSVDGLPPETVAVNHRAVRSKAILRAGDHIRIGSLEMVLRGAELDTSTPPQPFEACGDPEAPAKMLLRGISGKNAGRVFSLARQLRFGAGEDADVAVSQADGPRAVLGCNDQRLFVQVLDGGGEIDVNGYVVTQARLSAGDQIAIGEDRFVVEAPNFVPGDLFGEAAAPGGHGNTQVFQAVDMQSASGGEARSEARDASGGPAGGAERGRWDGLIIGVCVALSALMLAWLYFNR